MMDGEKGRAAQRIALLTAITILTTTVLLFVVEGAASVIMVLRSPTGVLLERSHTEFDPELGWINLPGIRVANLYGPKLNFETNSQRFRNHRAFDKAIPPNKVRAVCTGDSFTLGYGVSNEDAWCDLLSREDARLETVNMGQAGYGADQAYLWYRRDAGALNHDVLVAAFIADDFGRMMRKSFLGYPKPVLSVQNGAPVMEQRPSRLAFLASGLRRRAETLRNLQFLQLWRGHFEPRPFVDQVAMSDAKCRSLALAILENIGGLARRRGADLLVVLLPTIEDVRPSDADAWQIFLREELGKRQIPFLDLVERIRTEPAQLIPLLFRGHYNELGNRWAADRIYEALIQLPTVRHRLQQIGLPAQPVSTLMPPDLPLDLEAISLAGARIQASPLNEVSGLALDGSVSTRWHTGALQKGGEEIVLDLGKPIRFRQVRLLLGHAGYDYGRTLAVDVADENSGYQEILRVNGKNVDVTMADGGGAQILTLRESVEARRVRIRQVGRSDENFWSVCEIELYGQK